MKSKSLKILSLSIFFLIVFMSAVSALSISSDTTILSQEEGDLILTISGTPGEEITFEFPETIENMDGSEIEFISDLNPIILDVDGNVETEIHYNVINSNFEFEKEYSLIITATEEGTEESGSTTLNFQENTAFYTENNEGNLDVRDVEFDIIKGFGDDEDYWYPFDDVEVTFTVENNGEWDINDIRIEACLWDQERNKCIFDEDDMEISNDKFDLDSEDDKDITLNFNIDADKLSKSNKDYTFYLKAYGELDEGDNEGDNTGEDYSTNIEIITDDKFVTVEDIEFNPSFASCGQIIEISAKVWNVGEEDLDDDEVYVNIYNKDLGIDEVIEFDKGIDAMEYEKIEFSFEVPQEIDEGQYAIKFKVYDDDALGSDDIYVTDIEEDEAYYQGLLEIEGACQIIPSVSVSASLGSEAIEGKDLVINALITNTGDQVAVYTINVEGYGSWAEFISLEPASVILNPGKSDTISITLKPNKGSSGEQSFNIEVLSSEGEQLLEQPVSVGVEEAKGFLAAITGGVIGSAGNSYVWIIGALNILLVVIIIAVAMKVAKKSE